MGIFDGLYNRWFKSGISADDADASTPEALTANCVPPSAAIRFVGATVTHVPEKNRTDIEVSAGAVADGSVTTAKLADGAVTLAKQANMAGPAAIGRLSGTGVPQLVPIAEAQTATTLPVRTSTGTVRVADATNAQDALAKGQHDTAIAAVAVVTSDHETRLDTAEGEIDALQAAAAVARTGSVDFNAAQAWAPLGAVIPQTASTATLCRLSVAVDHPLLDSGGDLDIPAATEALDVRVLVWRTGSNVADFVVESGSASWNVGDVDVRLVDASGDWQIEVRKDVATTYIPAQIAQVRASIVPLVTVPWSSDTAPTVQSLGGGSVTAAAIIAEMVGEAFTGLLGAGIGGDGAGVSDDGATGLQLDGAQATLAQGILATAQTYLKRWVNDSKVAYVLEDVGGVTNALRQRFYDGAGAGNLTRTITHVAAGVVDTVVGTFTQVIGSTSRTQTSSSLIRIDQVPTGPLYTQASNAAGGQTNQGQTRLYAAADGTRFDWAYDGTVGLGVKVNPAGTCDVEVAAGATSLDIVKGGTRRLRVSANGIAGGLATASGTRSHAFGDTDTVASGSHSWASGLNVTTTKTYGVSMGANNDNIGVAAVQFGENLSNSDDSANCSQMGFQQTIGTNSPYSSAIGCYVNIGANCTGAFACGQSASIPDGRPGSFQHSSGCEGFAGTGWIDMMRLCTAAAAALQNQQGGAFFPENYSYGKYTIEVLACTDDAAIVARETITVWVKRGAGALTIETPVVADSTMAAAGWSVAVAEGATGELRITCDPGTDTVRFGARVSWSRIGATYNIVA